MATTSTDQPEAGPSSPRAKSPSGSNELTGSDSDSETSTKQDVQALSTPAPQRQTHPPSAPAHQQHIDVLPTETPISSSTPTTRVIPADISEFDPFATPVPPSRAVPPLNEGRTKDGSVVREDEVVDEPSTHTPRRERASAAGGGHQGEQGGDVGEEGEPEAVFNFPGFLKDLRLKSAEPVARYLKSFLSNFAKKPFTVNEQIKLIHDFLNFISGKMVLVEPWKSQSPAEFDNSMEAMEKLVMNRLYPYTFTPQLVPTQPITTDDLERDAVFAQRVRLFGWIREKHLDVPEGEASQGFLGFAEQELLKINHYKAPRDKMICILNCCKVIFGLIRHTHGTSAESTSADTFVPILIYVVLHANPENMLSNVEYINRFRTASKLSGEAGYYLSSLQGAIAFIETMDASSLSDITQEEFETNVEKAIQELPPSPSSRTSRRLHSASSTTSEMSPFAPSTPGEEPARPLALSTSFNALDNTKKFFQRTGTTITESVSKPLNAITKIFDGMQDTEGSTSGDEGEDETERRWRPGGQRDREAEIRQDLLTPQRRLANTRPFTPESPSRFAALGLSPDSQPPSGSGTPMRDVPQPNFSTEELQSTLDMSQEAYAQARRGNVQTLHQMFPDLDEDVAEAVLESCNEDLGMAIDRLLEM